MTVSRFSLRNNEWVCAGCGQPMVETTDVEAGGQAPREVGIDHASGCRYAPAPQA